jgi:hypothetical protein
MKIAFVAIEPVYPPHGGGQVRMAGLISALEAAGHTVQVFDPTMYTTLKGDRSIRHFASRNPRQGNIRINAKMKAAVLASGADVVFASISYLAPRLPRSIPLVIDFQNIEMERYASIAKLATGIHRMSAALESFKARRWEPRVARRAVLCIACTPEDAAVLQSWGADVVLAPHAADANGPFEQSPELGAVVYLASGGYGPNDSAGDWLIREVWPHVLERVPTARLRIVGRGTAETYAWVNSESISVVGEVESVLGELSRCSLTVAPVKRGAGAQLKIVTALAHGRTMVATSHSMRSVPAQFRPFVDQADTPDEFASAIVRALNNPAGRRRREEAIVDACAGWSESCDELLQFLDGLSI